MAKLQGLFFGLATVVLVAVATFYFAKPWIPALASDRGAVDSAIAASLLVTGIVFIVTNLLLAYVSWRFTDREGARAAYWHDNHKLEWAWTSATAVIMFVFLFNALGLWNRIARSDPPKDAVVVQVTGQQFRWVFHYPGEDGVFGRTDLKLIDPIEQNYVGLDKSSPGGADDIQSLLLVLPANRAARLRLRSTDVIHSLFLPNFRVKQDAMPGMTVETWFTPKQAGTFEIACAEHCGANHFKMRGQLEVVEAASDEDYNRILREKL